MTRPTSLKTLSTVCGTALILGLGSATAFGQDLARVNQDELASFYGRMNVVVGSGARAFGMGGAFLARADDATAASWNPAGLSYLRRIEVSLVGASNNFSQNIPRATTSTPAQPVTTLDELRGSVADFAGLAYPLRIKDRTGAIQVSYQRSFSFAGKRSSEAISGSREFSVTGEGGFDSVSLSSGFELRSNLRMGISLNRWVNGFSQTVQRRTRTRIDSDWQISGTNFNFGALFTPAPKVNLGAVFKTPFRASVVLTKTRMDTVDSGAGRTESPVRRDNVQIHFPRVFGIGASFRPTNTITISADFTQTAWSQARIENFFSLAPTDSAPTIDEYSMPLPFPAVEEGAAGQADTSQIRLGAEWVLRLGKSGGVVLPVRGGFFRDGQPVVKHLSRESAGPVSAFKPTFTGWTSGAGITVRGVLIDIAYIRELGDVPTSRYGNGVFDATTKVTYSRLFASMMVRFGPRR